jgi:hypothetical protein
LSLQRESGTRKSGNPALADALIDFPSGEERPLQFRSPVGEKKMRRIKAPQLPSRFRWIAKGPSRKPAAN